MKDLDSAFDKAAKALDAELRAFKASQNEEAAARNQEFADQKKHLDEQQNEELAGKGVDTHLLEQYRKELDDLQGLLETEDFLAEADQPVNLRLTVRNSGPHWKSFVALRLHLGRELTPCSMDHLTRDCAGQGHTVRCTAWLRPQQEA